MTSYIARHGAQKKKNLLRQKELELRGNIRRGATQAKLARSAEKVRASQLGVLKALVHESRPIREEDEEKASATLANLQEVKEYWTAISVEEIIQIYSEGLDDETVVDRKRWWDFRPR